MLLHDKMSSKYLLDKNALPDIALEKTEKNNLEQIRLKTKKFFATTFIGVAYTNLLLVLSVLSSLQYIVLTYFKSGSHTDIVRVLIYYYQINYI